MAFNITLYKMNKRENSTKVPTSATSQSTKAIKLLENTSVSSPSFVLDLGFSPVEYNYIYCSTFRRYYFIRDWVQDHNMWIAQCEVDVLATYKSQINASTQYVSRSASDFDEYAIDTVYPATGEIATAKTSIDSEVLHGKPSSSNNTYQFLLSTIGGKMDDLELDDYKLAGVHYYAINRYSLAELIYRMSQQLNDYIDISFLEISEQLAWLLYQPFQYILSLKYFPCGIPSNCMGAGETIKFGYWDTDSESVQEQIHGKVIKMNTFTKYCKFSAPKHPQALTHGKYLNRPPYTSRILHFQPFGDFTINSDLMNADDNLLWCKITINPTAGDCRLEIKSTTSDDESATWEASPGRIIHTVNTQYAIDLPLTSNNIDLNSYASGVLTMISSVSQPNIIESLGGLVQRETSTLPTVNAKGSVGSFLSILTDSYLTSYYQLIGDIDIEDRGRPLNKKKVLSTLNGYCQCADADVDFLISGNVGATADELRKIKSYLESGFFLDNGS